MYFLAHKYDNRFEKDALQMDQQTNGQTDGWTDGPTNQQTLIKRCVDASKNIFLKCRKKLFKIMATLNYIAFQFLVTSSSIRGFVRQSIHPTVHQSVGPCLSCNSQKTQIQVS